MPCDTLVFVRGPGGPAATLFGKNSDRPSSEAQEVVHIPAADHASSSVLKCTYIEIPQVAHTHAVVLSRPAWLWGCEMGANEHGVVGGNEAIHTRLKDELGSDERLLGMDLLRLGLERSRTAEEAMRVCAAMVEAHGQGGACAEGDPSLSYENAFLFADAHEAFVLETAGVHHWACERIEGGTHRNISNLCSIREPHGVSPSIKDVCLARSWWDGEGEFRWAEALGQGEAFKRAAERTAGGSRHLGSMAAAAKEGALEEADRGGWLRRMAATLRDAECGICFAELDGVCSTGSMISWLPPPTTAPASGAAAASELAAKGAKGCSLAREH
jgi:secernin